MPTNNFVESSFWNFDSLFQPQQHPARDAHDTFFMAGQGYTCFVDTFSYNLGQKVLRILHFLTHSTPIPQIWYCYVVQLRSEIIVSLPRILRYSVLGVSLPPLSTGKLDSSLACLAVDLNSIVFLDPKFAKLEEMPQSYIEKVKTMHESGGHGSQG